MQIMRTEECYWRHENDYVICTVCVGKCKKHFATSVFKSKESETVSASHEIIQSSLMATVGDGKRYISHNTRLRNQCSRRGKSQKSSSAQLKCRSPAKNVSCQTESGHCFADETTVFFQQTLVQTIVLCLIRPISSTQTPVSLAQHSKKCIVSDNVKR